MKCNWSKSKQSPPVKEGTVLSGREQLRLDAYFSPEMMLRRKMALAWEHLTPEERAEWRER